MDDKVPTRIWLSPAAFGYKSSPSPTYIYDASNREPQDVQFTRTEHVISTIRAVGERMRMTNDLVDAIVDAVREG